MIEAFNLGAILLSLAPVLVIFFRQSWQTDLLNFLMAFCLVSFFHQFLVGLLPLTPESRSLTEAAFNLAEFVILLYLLRAYLQAGWAKSLFNLFAVAFLSVQLTVYALHGIGETYTIFNTIQAIVILVMAVLALAQLIRTAPLNIFQWPVFWIITGTGCYCSMFLLVSLAPQYGRPMLGTQQEERSILLLSLLALRSIFFIVAGAVKPRPSRTGPEQQRPAGLY